MNRLVLYGTLLISVCGLSGCFATALVGGGTATSSAVHDERSLGEHFDDAAVSSKIDARLIAEKDMPSRWISAEVIAGKVLLTGYLPRQEQIDRAVYICRHVSGVRSVRSEIKLGEPPARELLSDTWVTTRVKRELFNDEEVSGFSVHVETVDGKVYLQGIVGSSLQRQRAATLTKSVKGVTSVVNLLHIKN
ncbi:MAG: division/outer membrane stress-associated lipid-binding lipoprotein [Zetaproteobacteria bacterium]|nr:MAG: division/outer membrane stress-associated lipid-binding lipoprotein [Zetaproteobacteria bacterium]